MDGNVFLGSIIKKYKYGSVFDLELTKTSMELQILWENFPPTAQSADFSVIKIEAENIYWENIPNLSDQFF